MQEEFKLFNMTLIATKYFDDNMLKNEITDMNSIDDVIEEDDIQEVEPTHDSLYRSEVESLNLKQAESKAIIEDLKNQVKELKKKINEQSSGQ